jgi:hypothetical protein
MTDTAPGILMGQPGRDDLTRACSGPVTAEFELPTSAARISRFEDRGDGAVGAGLGLSRVGGASAEGLVTAVFARRR